MTRLLEILKQGGILPIIIDKQLWFLAQALELEYRNIYVLIKYLHILIYFYLEDDNGEPHTLGELFLSLQDFRPEIRWLHKGLVVSNVVMHT